MLIDIKEEHLWKITKLTVWVLLSLVRCFTFGWRNFLCQIMATCKINIFIIRSTCCYYFAVLKDAICFRLNRKLELLNEYTNTRLDFYNHDSLQELWSDPSNDLDRSHYSISAYSELYNKYITLILQGSLQRHVFMLACITVNKCNTDCKLCNNKEKQHNKTYIRFWCTWTFLYRNFPKYKTK